MTDADALLRTADRALGQGDLTGAIAAYRAALAAAPARADGWYNLGWALRADRQFEEALVAYDAALRHVIVRPEEVELNRAAILSEHLGRTDEAIAALDSALRRRPDFVEAWLGLANLREDHGAFDAARDAYRRVLAIAPGNGRAHARIAALDLATTGAGQIVDALKRALAAARQDADIAELLFALGAAQDAAGDYRDAFYAYEAANVIARRLGAPAYQRAAQEQLVNAQIAAFASPDITKVGETIAADSTRPSFICGMFRSGSTLAETLLGRHSRITSGGEREEIPAFAARIAGYPGSVPQLSPATLADYRRRYGQRLPAAGIVTDKRCDNIFHLGLVRRLFPAAPIIHTRRIALDNILSVYFLHFGEGVTYGNDLADVAHYYIQYRRMLAHWRLVMGEALIDLDYDQLVRAPHDTLMPALGAMGLDWEEQCLATDGSSGAVRTASNIQVRQPLHARSSGRWRHYAHALDGVRRLLRNAGFDAEADGV
ncbi:sulfotransferase [Sphingomonas sp. GlSt437]